MKNNSFKEIFSNLIKIFKLLKDQKFIMITFTFLSILMAAISFITPLLSAKLVIYITDGAFKNLIIITSIIFAIELLDSMLIPISGKIFAKYTTKAILFLQIKLVQETLSLDIQEIETKSSGIFVNRLNNDTEEIIYVFRDLSDGISHLLGNIGVLFAILVINKFIFLFFIIAITTLFLLEKKRMALFFKSTDKLKTASEENTGLITELTHGFKDIKVLNIEDSFLEIIKSKLNTHNDEYYKMKKTNSNYIFIINVGRDSIQLFLILLLVYLNINGKITTPTMVIIYMYKDRLIYLLNYFSYVIESLKKFNLAANRVFEIIEKNILKSLSFNIKANEIVAFVGRSGSGKTQFLTC